MRDLVIIGSGPAGLSAAIYAKRAKLDVVVIEKAGYSGGQIITTERIDNYLGLPEIDGFSLGNRFREHADKLEAEFIDDEAKKNLWEWEFHIVQHVTEHFSGIK